MRSTPLDWRERDDLVLRQIGRHAQGPCLAAGATGGWLETFECGACGDDDLASDLLSPPVDHYSTGPDRGKDLTGDPVQQMQKPAKNQGWPRGVNLYTTFCRSGRLKQGHKCPSRGSRSHPVPRPRAPALVAAPPDCQTRQLVIRAHPAAGHAMERTRTPDCVLPAYPYTSESTPKAACNGQYRLAFQRNKLPINVIRSSDHDAMCGQSCQRRSAKQKGEKTSKGGS